MKSARTCWCFTLLLFGYFPSFRVHAFWLCFKPEIDDLHRVKIPFICYGNALGLISCKGHWDLECNIYDLFCTALLSSQSSHTVVLYERLNVSMKHQRMPSYKSSPLHKNQHISNSETTECTSLQTFQQLNMGEVNARLQFPSDQLHQFKYPAQSRAERFGKII